MSAKQNLGVDDLQFKELLNRFDRAYARDEARQMIESGCRPGRLLTASVDLPTILERAKAIGASFSSEPEEGGEALFSAVLQFEAGRPSRCRSDQEKLAALEAVLDLGADPNYSEPRDDGLPGFPAMAYLVAHDRLVKDGVRVPVMECLINHGADIRRQVGNEGTVLHLACWRNSVAVIDLLMRNGADPVALDPRGETPIDIARSTRFGDAMAVFDRVESEKSAKSLLDREPRKALAAKGRAPSL